MGSSLEKEAKNVNKLGDRKFKQKNYGEAIKLYEESIELMEEAGNRKKAEKYQKELDETVAKRAKEINEEGDALFKNKEYKKAIEVYKSALRLLKKAGSKWEKKYGKEFHKELNKSKRKYVKEDLKEVADNLEEEGKLDEAARVYGKILEYISPEVDPKLHREMKEEVNDLYERWGKEINETGDQLYKDENYEEAIKAYTRAIRLIKKSGKTKKLKNFQKELTKAFKEHAEEINKLGDKLLKEKNYKEAADLYEESVNIAKQAKDEKLIKKFTKEMDKAFEKLAQEINEEADDLYKAKNYEDAAKVYRRSLNIAIEHNQKKAESKFRKEYEKAIEKWAAEVNSLGDAERKAKKWEAAIKHYKESIQIISKIGKEKRIKEYSKEFRKTCLTLAKEINENGDKLYKSDKYKEAFKLYEKSVKLAEMAEDRKAIKKFSKERNKALAKMDY